MKARKKFLWGMDIKQKEKFLEKLWAVKPSN